MSTSTAPSKTTNEAIRTSSIAEIEAAIQVKKQQIAEATKQYDATKQTYQSIGNWMSNTSQPQRQQLLNQWYTTFLNQPQYAIYTPQQLMQLAQNKSNEQWQQQYNNAQSQHSSAFNQMNEINNNTIKPLTQQLNQLQTKQEEAINNIITDTNDNTDNKQRLKRKKRPRPDSLSSICRPAKRARVIHPTATKAVMKCLNDNPVNYDTLTLNTLNELELKLQYEMQKNIVIEGCNHFDLCDECEQKLQPKICLRCQAPFTNITKLKI
eukprot:981342_1